MKYVGKNPFILIGIISLGIFNSATFAQKKITPTSNLVYVDKQGVLRYTKGNGEAAFFGVNYTTPFAFAFRAHKALNVNIEKAIQDDVYHMARLGFDAFRVHIWDTEITDTSGNLLENEHLRLYDFLLAELKKRNIKTIITPIAFWGNGYPERDEKTPGFSHKYGKAKALTNDTAIRAQENYLRQLFDHVNPYTKQAYKDDPDVIALEINNEPQHTGSRDFVTNYVNRLAAAARSTGWAKPVYYNISESPGYADAVVKANVDGVSFQWYPTGLVSNATAKGNYLPNVDRYTIPFDTIAGYKNKSLMVYEFDAADILQSNMYPAMARSFREAGFQWATQFAYDPMAIANVNTEYQTHYLNLAYTPSKAISMLIASKVFHKLPRKKNYGRYPADSLFDVFRVSYTEGLSEMNTATEFYYSNSTQTKPSVPGKLEHIAGVGSSSIIKYQGTGAYFLDKIEEGVWRLEVMPDVIYIRDPFEKASPKKEVTRINWRSNQMQMRVADLGNEFSIKALNNGNDFSVQSIADSFSITPGTYILTKKGKTFSGNKNKPGSIGLNEFVAPPSSGKEIIVRHEPFKEVSAGRSFIIDATIAGLDAGQAYVQLNKLGGGLWRNVPMTKVGYEYSAEIPADVVTTGRLEYRIIAGQEDSFVTYPGNISGNPFAWDNYQFDTYKTTIAAGKTSLELYNAAMDRQVQVQPNSRRGFQTSYVSGGTTGALAFKLSITEVKKDEVIGFQTYIGDKLKQRSSELRSFDKIIVRGKTSEGQTTNVKITLVDKNGSAFSATGTLSGNLQNIELPLGNFTPGIALLLPRPYPGFLPLYFQSSVTGAVLDLGGIEKIQISSAPLLPTSNDTTLSVEIESVRLVQYK